MPRTLPALAKLDAPAAEEKSVPAGPVILPRADAVAPVETPIEQRPARLAPLPLSKPGARPADPGREKPAALPEERLAPLVRTSPTRPSLRRAPAPESEGETLAHEPPPAANAEPSRPGPAESDPDLPQFIPPPDTAESIPPAEPEVVGVAASEPVAAAESEPAGLPKEAQPEAPGEQKPAPPEPEAAMPAAELVAPDAPRARAPRARAVRAANASPTTTAAAAVSRAPIRAQWPTEEEMTSPLKRWARGVSGVLLIAALFAVGWLLGGVAVDTGTGAKKPNPLVELLQMFWFATGRYHVSVATEPDGASIAVDGKDLAKRTPAVIDLKPGAHQLTLSYPELGSATFGVRGMRDQNVILHEALWGRLSVEQDNPEVPVSVSVDGRDLGFVPVTLDSVSPGAHEVRFSGPNMTPWAQTVAVKVRESAHIVAHPMVSPATGVLSVRATLNDQQGSTPLAGGEVWLDGQVAGRTPLTLELPRGPHSVKVVYGQKSAPVQVIDLPGGNQRFASFQLGAGVPDIQLTPVSVASRVLADQPALVSAGLSGVHLSDVREMWLHVRGPDDNWRRYALNVMQTPDAVVGVTTFPLGVFDNDGLTKYYLSALLITGDEYFTEIASAQLVAAPRVPTSN